jgi:hypothetical protein
MKRGLETEASSSATSGEPIAKQPKIEQLEQAMLALDLDGIAAVSHFLDEQTVLNLSTSCKQFMSAPQLLATWSARLARLKEIAPAVSTAKPENAPPFWQFRVLRQQFFSTAKQQVEICCEVGMFIDDTASTFKTLSERNHSIEKALMQKLALDISIFRGPAFEGVEVDDTKVKIKLGKKISKEAYFPYLNAVFYRLYQNSEELQSKFEQPEKGAHAPCLQLKLVHGFANNESILQALSQAARELIDTELMQESLAALAEFASIPPQKASKSNRKPGKFASALSKGEIIEEAPKLSDDDFKAMLRKFSQPKR